MHLFSQNLLVNQNTSYFNKIDVTNLCFSRLLKSRPESFGSADKNYN